MGPAPRYALYLAPPPEAPLWRFGSRVLGYDAATGEDLHGFAPPGLTPDAWRLLTRQPRVYGFHATLKAPFRLARDARLSDLEAELDAFGRSSPPFDLGPLAVSRLAATGERAFAALTPVRNPPELDALEQAVVRRFDRFRAPLSPDERLKRRPEALTARQRRSLDAFGYPYTGPDFRFHMTLSGPLTDAPAVADALAAALAREIGTAQLIVDALVLFEQPAPDRRFRIVGRFPLSSAMGTSAPQEVVPVL